MNVDTHIFDLLTAKEEIEKRGFVPRRLWKLYRKVMGHRVYRRGNDGTIHLAGVIDTALDDKEEE